MPSFDLTTDDLILLGCIVFLVMLPSRLPAIGNALGRFLSRGSTDQPKA